MIRVLRLMEYTYPDLETMIQDRGRWAIQGVRSVGIGSVTSIKSTTLPIDLVDNPVGIEKPSHTHARVILFKASGKYYTEEQWEIPEGAIGPYDMQRSKDFRRIDNGPVLVVTQEPWGFPYIL